MKTCESALSAKKKQLNSSKISTSKPMRRSCAICARGDSAEADYLLEVEDDLEGDFANDEADIDAADDAERDDASEGE